MISKFIGWTPNNLSKLYLIFVTVLVGCTIQDTEVSDVSVTLYPTETKHTAITTRKLTEISLVQRSKSDELSTLTVSQIDRDPTNITTIGIETATNVPTNAATTKVTSTFTDVVPPSVVPMTPTDVSTNAAITKSTSTSTNTVTSTIVPVTDTPTSTLVPTQWPTPDALVDDRLARVPILMYHYIEPLPNDADNIRIGLTVQPGVFRQQLAYLHAQGYNSVSLYDLTYHLTQGVPLPDKPIVFCFDDGYRGLYQHAVPHMKAFGYTGTVFVLTQLMDEQHPSYLTWEMAHKMYESGWKIEPHSKTHVQLSSRPFELVQYQVLGSMQTVQAHIDRQPRYFSYPSGLYDQQVIEYLKELGFWGAVTTEFGLKHDFLNSFTWKRVRVSGNTTIDVLAKYLDE